MQEEPRYRISKIMGAMIVITAFSIDAFEMLLEWLGIGILGLSSLISVCATTGFGIWFAILGVGFMSPKKFFTSFATVIAEVIPGLDALGGFFWTLGAVAIVIMTRSEDKGGLLGQAANVIPKKTRG